MDNLNGWRGVLFFFVVYLCDCMAWVIEFKPHFANVDEHLKEVA